MKPVKPAPVASDVADGIRQSLGKVTGLSFRDVKVSGNTITVTAPGASEADKRAIKSVLDGYRDSGFPIGIDTRAGI